MSAVSDKSIRGELVTSFEAVFGSVVLLLCGMVGVLAVLLNVTSSGYCPTRCRLMQNGFFKSNIFSIF